MSESDAHICLVCRDRFDPNEEVIRVIQDSFDFVGGDEVARSDVRFVHPHEEEQARLEGWRTTTRGRLKDLR